MKKQHGFTIVELIIVIAVIGVLAAILIPTFSNVIKKANIAADKTTARNLNTYFASQEKEDGAFRNIDEALCMIADTEYAQKVKKPQTEGYQFMWVAQFNRIAVIDTQGELQNRENWIVVYPEEYVRFQGNDKVTFLSKDNLFEVNRIVSVNTGWINENKGKIQNATAENPVTVSVNSANELAAVAAMTNDIIYEEQTVGGVTKLVRTGVGSNYATFEHVTVSIGSNISLDGTIWTPIGVAETDPFKGTIEGNRHTIVGLTNFGFEPSAANVFTTANTKTTGSAYGLIAYAGTKVTISNLNMKNVAIDMVNKGNPTDAKNGLCVGALVGFATYANSTELNITSCSVTGSIRGVNDIGGLVGKFYGVTLNMTNCTNAATVIAELTGKAVKGGGLCGYVSYAGIKTFTNCKNAGTVVVTSRDGFSAYAGGIYGGSTSAIDIVVDNFENTGTISAVSSTQKYAGQISGQTAVKKIVLKGAIVLSGSSTISTKDVNPHTGAMATYDSFIDVSYDGATLFGYCYGTTNDKSIGSTATAITYDSGATINGTALSGAS